MKYRSGLAAVSVDVAHVHDYNVSTLEELSLGDTPGVPGGYLDAVTALYQSTLGCASPVSLTPGDVFIASSLSGVQRRYDSLKVTANSLTGPLFVSASFLAARARIDSNNQFLDVASSAISSSGVTPYVPNVRILAALTYQAKPNRAAFTLSGSYYGNNNLYRAAPFTNLRLNLGLPTPDGTLNVGLVNLLNENAGIYNTAASRPYVTSYGIVLPTLQTPVVPRSLVVSYTVKVGPSDKVSDEPIDTEGGIHTEGTSYYKSLKLDDASVAFAAKPGQGCSAKLGLLSSKLGQALKRFSAASTQDYANADVMFERAGNEYISIKPRSQDALDAYLHCSELHLGVASDLKSLGVVSPPQVASTLALFYWYPTIGLVTLTSDTSSGNAFQLTPITRQPPPNPFMINSSCSVADQDVTKLLLTAFSDYKSRVPLEDHAELPAFTIQRTAASPQKAWYELHLKDQTMLQLLFRCSQVHEATQAQLRRFGYGGAVQPAVNFADPFGFYIVR